MKSLAYRSLKQSPAVTQALVRSLVTVDLSPFKYGEETFERVSFLERKDAYNLAFNGYDRVPFSAVLHNLWKDGGIEEQIKKLQESVKTSEEGVQVADFSFANFDAESTKVRLDEILDAPNKKLTKDQVDTVSEALKDHMALPICVITGDVRSPAVNNAMRSENMSAVERILEEGASSHSRG